ncbi:hypothetical protein MSAN_00250400 [Mycena sanguinolenta]|uniref:DUF6534 domain-containing protein n=1 Tax=Mycena sanguinolenta TaxID=230812 RepID=A0A8H7DLU3_9AGAR|nr:hypothetical protein MSAN_00250400 [Mycena sanguinolenta]
MGEFDGTIGFTLMGVIVNTYLTGVIMTQFFTYLAHSEWFPRWIPRIYNGELQDLPGFVEDPLWVRCLVAFLFAINVTQAAAVVYMAWFYCVTNFANKGIIDYIPWPYPFTALTTAILAITNQLFQTWKIYLFTRNKTLVAFLTATSLAACGLGITAAVKTWLELELTKIAALQPVVEANLALQCGIDVIIATILTLTLRKSKTSITRTDRILNRLIRIAVQSGSFTAFFALGTLFSFRFSSQTEMLGLFALSIGRVYTHTMMDHLVCREQLRHMLTNNNDIMSVPHFHVRSVGVNGSSGVIEPLSLRPTQTLPKVSKTAEGP